MGLLGEMVIRNDGVVYTPGVPRQADSATFKVDVLTFYLAGGAPSMTITVEHRNQDEDSWSTADTFAAVTAAGLATRTVSGLKDLVRLSFQFTAGPTASFARFVILPPVWDLTFEDEEWPEDSPPEDDIIPELLPNIPLNQFGGSGGGEHHFPGH